MAKENRVAVATVPLPTRIIEVRGVKVLLDAELAELYAVSTKALNQAIKRNRQKFPPLHVSTHQRRESRGGNKL